mgnify:CR=1 FL=1
MKRKIILLLTGLLCLSGLKAYQYTNVYTDGSVVFRLWVPPTTQNVRGLFIVLHQMLEEPPLDSLVRLACSVEDIAIITMSSSTDTNVFKNGLANLASVSGMPEIQYAPFMTLGHSAAGIYAKNLGFYMAKRCFGIIQFNAVDYTAPSGYTMSGIAGVPFMSIKNMDEPTGDNWIQARNSMVSNLRSAGILSHLVSQPGGGHFGWTDFEARFISLFIQKAAHYQIPYGIWAKTGLITLTRMAEADGWLADTTITTDPLVSPAAYADYAGIKANAYWFFDYDHAKTWLMLHRQEYQKVSQTVTQTAFSCSNPWSDCLPTLSLNGTNPVNFGASASSGLGLEYKAYYGNFTVSGGMVYMDAARQGLNVTNRDWVTISQPGTSNYRYAETVARVRVDTSGGTAQTISFTDITDKVINDADFPFTATASSGLAVDYYVVAGAIEKSGSNWSIADFSVPVSNVAIHYGQRGNGTYASVANTTGDWDYFNITNSRDTQWLLFPPIPDKVKTDPSFTVSATSGSGLPVEFKIFSGPATIAGNTVTLTGDTGVIVIMAETPANNSYKGAKKVQYVNVFSTLVSASAIQHKGNKMKVYPNPVSDVLYISGAAGATVYLINEQGAVIQSVVIRDSLAAINISQQSEGICFVRVVTADGVTVKKCIIQRNS